LFLLSGFKPSWGKELLGKLFFYRNMETITSAKKKGTSPFSYQRKMSLQLWGRLSSLPSG
jgi:hypothetical protein